MRRETAKYALVGVMLLLQGATGCDNTLAVRPEAAYAREGGWHPDVVIRIGESSQACDSDELAAISDGADMWCRHTEGRFCPRIMVSEAKSAAAVSCKPGTDGERAGQATWWPDKSWEIWLKFEKTIRSEWAALAAHELGHIYQGVGGAEFEGADAAGHTPSGLMNPYRRVGAHQMPVIVWPETDSSQD